MEKRDLIRGDVVQLNPSMENFGGMLLIVEEPKVFGCQGYLLSPNSFDAVRFKSRAYLRPKWEDMEYIGHLEWIQVDEDHEE